MFKRQKQFSSPFNSGCSILSKHSFCNITLSKFGIQGSICQITIHTAGALKLLLEELHWDLDWTKHTKINSSYVVDDVYIHIDGMSLSQ